MSARVLVVDDVPHNVKLLEVRLTREYYDVITAENGFDALELARSRDPDIILLDVMMPGMDGFEVCRRIKESPDTSHIRVIMVTSLSDRTDRLRGLEAGADDFLTKPVNDIILFARIESLVRLKRAMDEWRLREASRESLAAIGAVGDAAGANGSGADILLVEDSAALAANIEAALATDNHRVEIYARCDDALARLKERDFDLIIIALMLDGQDGLRLCSQVRSTESTRHTAILTIVDEGDIERLTKGLDLGVNDCIFTPVDRHELLARARTLVHGKRYQDRLRASYERSIEMALTDGLTGLYNRRYFETHLRTLLDRSRAAGRPLSLIMLDVDNFKTINDSHGHGAGDDVLRETARRLNANVRTFDTVARIGGDEFVILMPGSGRAEALAAAERVHAGLIGTPVPLANGAPISITASVGVAEADVSRDDVAASLERADEALYEAKRRGRNCVVTLAPVAGEIVIGAPAG